MSDVAGELLRGASLNDVERVTKLLDAGVPVDIRGDQGVTALLCAAKDGSEDVVALLIERGADLNSTGDSDGPFHQTPLCLAANSGHQNVVSMVLEAGADPALTDRDGFTPLMCAASMGRRDIVAKLLHSGGDTNARTSEGDTALILAARPLFEETGEGLGGDAGTVKLLLEAGADPKATNDEGDTALDIAKRARLDDVAALLRKAGA
jgi:ankyrin repeat protein